MNIEYNNNTNLLIMQVNLLASSQWYMNWGILLEQSFTAGMLSLMATRIREKTLEFLSVLPTPSPQHRNKYGVVVVCFFCN